MIPEANDCPLPPVSCNECNLGSFTVYGPTFELSANAICARRREIRTLAAGRTILREGNVANATSILYSSWAFRFKQLRNGKRQILSFLLPGDVLVLETLSFLNFPLPFSVKALTPISTCVFSTEEMRAMLHGFTGQEQRLALAQETYLSAMNEHMLSLGRRSAPARVAALLLELYQRLRGRNMVIGNSFEFPVRQEHLADALGLTTVYINRLLVTFRNRKIIDFDRRRMSIIDLAELNRIAQDE